MTVVSILQTHLELSNNATLREDERRDVPKKLRTQHQDYTLPLKLPLSEPGRSIGE